MSEPGTRSAARERDRSGAELDGSGKGAIHRFRSTCRACGGDRFERFLELGPTPLANSFPASPDEFVDEPSFPLDLYFCEDCSLIQLLDVIDPEFLFRDYIYVTGTSETIAAHNARYARTVVDRLELGDGDLVVEVASNDGSLLACFQPYGVRVLGVEPATNIAAMARDRGVPTVNRFFDHATARELRREHGPTRAVIGNNVLAHVDETRDFLLGCREVLATDGQVIVEVPYLGEMIDRLEYDTVYHEHLCYFSVTALIRLFQAVGLSIVRMDRVPVHGGSLRVYAGHRDRHPEHASDVLAVAERERARGLTEVERLHRFARDVAAHREALRGLLEELAGEGRSLAGYGAPAKGNTLLNYCGIGTELLPFTTDRNPLKVGRFTPGTHVPVLPASALLERQPEMTLILAWNFAEEILAQQREYRNRGGQFIIPIPEPRVV